MLNDIIYLKSQCKRFEFMWFIYLFRRLNYIPGYLSEELNFLGLYPFYSNHWKLLIVEHFSKTSHMFVLLIQCEASFSIFRAWSKVYYIHNTSSSYLKDSNLICNWFLAINTYFKISFLKIPHTAIEELQNRYSRTVITSVYLYKAKHWHRLERIVQGLKSVQYGSGGGNSNPL